MIIKDKCLAYAKLFSNTASSWFLRKLLVNSLLRILLFYMMIFDKVFYVFIFWLLLISSFVITTIQYA